LQRSGSRKVATAYVLVALGWVGVRVWAFAHAHEIEFPDSATYLEKAASPLWTRDFFFGAGRFFVVPLIYKWAALPGSSRQWLTATQLGISLGAWLLLAWAVAAPIARRWLGVLSFAAVLTFGLTADVVQWDTIVLSESITTSAFVLVIAACLALAHRVSAGRVIALGAAFVAFGMSREASSLLLLPIGVSLTCWAVWFLRETRPRLWSFALACLTIVLVVVSFSVSGRGVRWFFPLLNVVGQRILPAPDRLAFYEARGMPVNETLRGMAGEFASGRNSTFYRSFDLVEFRAWIGAHGRQTYALDLLAHPGRTLVEPLQDVTEFVCPEIRQYRPAGFIAVLPPVGTSFCAPRRATTIVAATCLAGIALFGMVFAWRRRLSPADGLWLLLVAAMLASWQPFVWMTWHVIGGMEVGRHVFSGVLQCRLAGLLLMLFAARQLSSRLMLLVMERANRIDGGRAPRRPITRRGGDDDE